MAPKKPRNASGKRRVGRNHGGQIAEPSSGPATMRLPIRDSAADGVHFVRSESIQQHDEVAASDHSRDNNHSAGSHHGDATTSSDIWGQFFPFNDLDLSGDLPTHVDQSVEQVGEWSQIEYHGPFTMESYLSQATNNTGAQDQQAAKTCSAPSTPNPTFATDHSAGPSRPTAHLRQRNTQANILLSLNASQPTDPPRFHCNFPGCGKPFTSPYGVRKHKDRVHKASRWMYQCNDCRYQTYGREHDMKRHCGGQHEGSPNSGYTKVDLRTRGSAAADNQSEVGDDGDDGDESMEGGEHGQE